MIFAPGNRKKRHYLLPVVLLSSLGSSAWADGAAGHWAVAGNVDGKDFTLDCRFEQTGEKVTGACVDGPTGNAAVPGGTSHPLLEGHVQGDELTWMYQSSYAFIKFDVHYSGRYQGQHMSGTIAAAGKTGSFTANRLPP